MKFDFQVVQSLGRALMLPIAVLPAAALLLRLGQPDLLNIPFVAASGSAIFSNLGLLFAIGVAVGLARENHGAAGLAGAVCFLVTTTGAQALIDVPPDALAGFAGKSAALAANAYKAGEMAKLGVPAGILSGLIAGWLYNRFHDIRLPDYLAFFGGRRFVPIAAGFAALIPAALIGLGAPAIEHAMDIASRVVLNSGAIGLFLYGVLNRVLIVTGLHHVINNLAWFILGDYHGVTGDLNRFFAGDPTAGKFMSGFFPVMMFGLPAACLAMYHTALPARRKAVGGLLLSMSLTAFFTGVTEPIEFAFMFLAPVLYGVHTVLTGLSMVIMDALGVRLGFGFSAGLFDYVINFGKSTRPLLLLPVGLAYFAIYYVTFRFVITRFNLKTLGRETDAPAAVAAQPAHGAARGAAFAAALGGASNLRKVDACTTRLRLDIADASRIDEAALRSLGARGFVRPSATALQVVLGPIADQVAGEIRAALASGASSATATFDAPAMLAALGGASNISAIAVHASRLVIGLRRADLAHADALRNAHARSTALQGDTAHIVIGPDAEAASVSLRAAMS